MDFIADIKVRVLITAKDKAHAEVVLKEKHGFLIGGGSTEGSKEYFVREDRSRRVTVYGPYPAEEKDLVPHKPKSVILSAKKQGTTFIHGVEICELKEKKSISLNPEEPEPVNSYAIDVKPEKPKSKFTRRVK